MRRLPPATALVLLVAMLAAAAGCASAEPRPEAALAADNFMSVLQAGDYRLAFSLLHQGLQAEMGDADGLKRAVEGAGCRPVRWEFQQVAADPPEAHMPVATITGTVAYSGQRQGTVVLYMVRLGGEWQVYSAMLQ